MAMAFYKNKFNCNRLIELLILLTLIYCLPVFAASQIVEKNSQQDIKPGGMVHFTVKGDFEEQKEMLKLAIAERGIKISNTSYISNMLQRTREDVGGGEQVYQHAEAIEFCSATISRNMMEANPHNILFCPYIIYIYELAQEPGVINLAYRKIPNLGSETSKKAFQQVNQLLEEIISESME